MPPPPLFLMDNFKMDRIPTKIKCKIHAFFVLTNFCKKRVASQVSSCNTIQPNSMTKFCLQIAAKKITTMVFPLLLREVRVWVILLMLWQKKIEHLCCPTIFVAAWWTVFLKLLFQNYKYQQTNVVYICREGKCFSICYFDVTKLYLEKQAISQYFKNFDGIGNKN